MLRTWTKWRAARVAEVRPASREDIEYNAPMWREEWAREVREAADRREEIPLAVARSYASYVGLDGADRALRTAANAEEISDAFRRTREGRKP